MSLTDNNVCLDAFNCLCEELSVSKLLDKEKCQYWVFESGYKAALEEMIANISAVTKSQGSVSLEEIYLAKKTSLH